MLSLGLDHSVFCTHSQWLKKLNNSSYNVRLSGTLRECHEWAFFMPETVSQQS
jgi:hypothetical protein